MGGECRKKMRKRKGKDGEKRGKRCGKDEV